MVLKDGLVLMKNIQFVAKRKPGNVEM